MWQALEVGVAPLINYCYSSYVVEGMFEVRMEKGQYSHRHGKYICIRWWTWKEVRSLKKQTTDMTYFHRTKCVHK